MRRLLWIHVLTGGTKPLSAVPGRAPTGSVFLRGPCTAAPAAALPSVRDPASAGGEA